MIKNNNVDLTSLPLVTCISKKKSKLSKILSSGKIESKTYITTTQNKKEDKQKEKINLGIISSLLITGTSRKEEAQTTDKIELPHTSVNDSVGKIIKTYKFKSPFIEL